MDSDRLIARVPNWLTFLRLLLIPVFVLLLANDPSPEMVRAATFVFILAAITDYVDGFIARRFRAVSDFGKLLDPLADKILVMAALVMLTSLRSDVYGEPWVPGWMVCLVLAREIWITGLRGIAASHGYVLAASSAGKVKSSLQMVSLVLLLLHDYRITIFGLELTAEAIGLRLLLLAILVSYWGAVEYTQAVMVAMRPDGVGEEPSAPLSSQVVEASPLNRASAFAEIETSAPPGREDP